MIFATAEDAMAWASDHPHIYDGLDRLGDGRWLVLTDLSVIPPDKPRPEPPPVPAHLTREAVHRLALPDHIMRVEEKLAAIPLKDRNGQRRGNKWHPMSEFWRKAIARVYFFGSYEAVFRVGRRGGKSSTMCRVIAAEVAYGDHVESGGTTCVFAVIAQDRKEAKQRIETTAEILADCGVDCDPKAESIELPALNRAVRVYTATKAGVSGFTAIGVLGDEVAKWRGDDGKNPGKEVIESVRPTMATQPGARLWLISSPWSVDDPHYHAFEAADSARLAFWAHSWVSNPSLTEGRTKALEPDEQVWRREYAAIPMPSESTAFFQADFVDDACILDLPEGHTVAAGGDLGFRNNSSALVIADATDGTFRVLSDREWIPVEKSLRPSDVINEMVQDMNAAGAESLCTDLSYIETVREHLEDTDIELIEFPNTNEGKVNAYLRVRALMAHGQIDLSRASAKLIRQLKQVRSKPTSNSLAIESPEIGGAHGDIASAFVAAIGSLELADEGWVVDGRRRFAGRDKPWREYAPGDWEVPAPDGAWWAQDNAGGRRF